MIRYPTRALRTRRNVSSSKYYRKKSTQVELIFDKVSIKRCLSETTNQ